MMLGGNVHVSGVGDGVGVGVGVPTGVGVGVAVGAVISIVIDEKSSPVRLMTRNETTYVPASS